MTQALPTPPLQFGIYTEHDYLFPIYDQDGNRHEGCRLCGHDRDHILANNLECVRPMRAPPGEFVRLLEPFAYGVPMRIDRESVENLRRALNAMYPEAK